jgi:hypothetical protein
MSNNESSFNEGLLVIMAVVLGSVPANFLVVGVIAFPVQIFVYLYKGTWFEASLCKYDNACVYFDDWEKWIGIGKGLKYIFNLHPFFTGLITGLIALLIALTLGAISLWVTSFLSDKLNK